MDHLICNFQRAHLRIIRSFSTILRTCGRYYIYGKHYLILLRLRWRSNVGIQERDWYQRDQRAKEYKAAGVKYKNSQGWYYRLNGYDFGPCDKDNICRLMREHRLDDSSLVKHGSGEWMQISKLRKEFPKGGYVYSQNRTAIVSGNAKGRFSLSIAGIILGAASLLLGVKCQWNIVNMSIIIALSVLTPSILKTEWKRKRAFSAIGMIAAIVLVLLSIYLVFQLYWALL